MSPLKRNLDIAAALAGLILLSPVLILVSVLVAVTSKGPVLFRQERVGKNERIFICNKFRTMHQGTAQRATHEVARSAVTRAGAVLRRFKLDELPQLWNVLCGDMSLVGPRPCLPSQTKLISERRRLNIFDIHPGITGLAQVEGVDMSQPKRLAEIEQRYMQSQSLSMDLGLIFRTLFSA